MITDSGSVVLIIHFLIPRSNHLLFIYVVAQGCELHVHAELEQLRLSLAEKQSQMTAMEAQCLRDSVELVDSVVAWQDKYERLQESHLRVQKVNQGLEDKLLKLVDQNTAERGQWMGDVEKLSVCLADANYIISNLRREIVSIDLRLGPTSRNTYHSTVPEIGHACMFMFTD